MSFLALEVAVLVPLSVTLLSESTCFYNMHTAYPNVITEYSTEECTSYDLSQAELVCLSVSLVVSQTSYQAAFNYSGECRNTFLLSYLPVIIYQNVYAAFIYPIILTIVGSKVNFKSLPFFLQTSFPLVLWPNEEMHESSVSVDYIILELICKFLLLFVFGIMDPFAAFIIGVSIFNISISYRMLYGRYINLHTTRLQSGTAEEQIFSARALDELDKRH